MYDYFWLKTLEGFTQRPQIPYVSYGAGEYIISPKSVKERIALRF